MSPYFSPNSAIAPWVRAYSCVVSYAMTGRSSASRAFAITSTSSSTSLGTASKCEKSNRSRPGATSEPA